MRRSRMKAASSSRVLRWAPRSKGAPGFWLPWLERGLLWSVWPRESSAKWTTGGLDGVIATTVLSAHELYTWRRTQKRVCLCRHTDAYAYTHIYRHKHTHEGCTSRKRIYAYKHTQIAKYLHIADQTQMYIYNTNIMYMYLYIHTWIYVHVHVQVCIFYRHTWICTNT